MSARSKVIAVLAIFIAVFWVSVWILLKFIIEALMLVWFYFQIK